MTDRYKSRASTHADGCWEWGPKHYECAVGKIERLQAEAVRLRNLRADAIHECALANVRAEMLAEALKEIRSRSTMNLAMQPDPFELTARLGDIYQIADAALSDAERSVPEGRGEQKANTLRIAAPELLEALKKVAQSLDWYAHGRCRGFDDEAPLPTNEAVELADRTLAKVRA